MKKKLKRRRAPQGKPKAGSTAAAKPSSRPVNLATTAQMARLFACTERQIQLLADQGIVKRVGHGKYDFAQSTTNYVEHLRAQAAGRAGVDPDTDTASANRERALENAALTRTRRLALEKKLIPVETAREVGMRLTRGIRQFVLGLSNSIAHEVPTLTAGDIAAIKRICADGLEDAAGGTGFDLANLPMDEASNDVSGGQAGARDSGDAEASSAGDAVNLG